MALTMYLNHLAVYQPESTTVGKTPENSLNDAPEIRDQNDR